MAENSETVTKASPTSTRRIRVHAFLYHPDWLKFEKWYHLPLQLLLELYRGTYSCEDTPQGIQRLRERHPGPVLVRGEHRIA